MHGSDTIGSGTITTDTQEHRRTHTMHSVTESEHGGVVNCVKNGRKVQERIF